MSGAAPRLLTLIAELTYSCRLRCVYCSNPTHVRQRSSTLSTADWQTAIDDAASLGALHVHFTGGEPLLRDDLAELVRHARAQQLYTNLITSGVPLTRERLVELVDAGLDHVQISLQAASEAANLRIAGVDATAHKVEVARWVKELGVALTINLVLHHQNCNELPDMMELAASLTPHRIELANAQYLGWALLNRDQLLPTRAELQAVRRLAESARERLRGQTDVLFVLPDYYADRPRACMQGWAQSTVVLTPDGLVLPCQAARDLPGLTFDDVRSAPLTQLWANSASLRKYRSSHWLPAACQDCSERAKDFGGCRCQAFALTGDVEAVDPACSLTPSHHLVRQARERTHARPVARPLVLRRAPQPDRSGSDTSPILSKRPQP